MNIDCQVRRVAQSLQMFCENTVVNFDRTGRFVRSVRGGQVIRRKLDGQLVRITELNQMNHLRQYETVRREEADSLMEQVYQTARKMERPADTETAQWLEKAQDWTTKLLKQDAARFYQAYMPVSILPPGEYQTVVVQATEGCSYNQCRFCDFYRDRPFHVKNEDQLTKHLSAIRELFGPRLQDRTGFFIGDGNALVVSLNRLSAVMKQISDSLPEVPRDFSIFMDTFNMRSKKLDELITLKNGGLRTVYVGLESGCDSLRHLLRKPGSAQEALTEICKLKDAGFRVGVMVLVGIGTGNLAKMHFSQTLELLQSIQWDKDDMVLVSPFVEPRDSKDWTELAGQIGNPATYEERLLEAHRWMNAFHEALPMKVSLYSVLEHLY